MRRPEIPLDWLACPVTKAALTLRDGALVSSHGHPPLRYAFHAVGDSGYWDLMPPPEVLAQPDWKVWEQLQANGVVSYEADPSHNLGVGKREDFLQFADFCAFRGNVLDVGVGPQRCPTHIEYRGRDDVFFVGVDPLVGEQPRCFAFVRALGEYLPFRAGVFDQVLFVTSLDHFIDPLPPLREAARVLARGGEICVWLGEKAKDAPKPAVSNPWYERLSVPAGADDRFHFKRFSAEQFERCLESAALRIAERRVQRIDAWRSHLFYRIHSRSSAHARD
jgi:SAM-dependent methyltransferase